MRKRKDLKIIVCSATVDAEEIKLYFDEGLKKKSTEEISLDSIIISVEGRYFPVEINYLTEPCDNYIKASVSTAIGIHVSEGNYDGDILIFLTGQDECEEVVSQLIDRAKDLNYDRKKNENIKKLWILPLYGSLPASEQLKVFDRTPRNTRKIIVSTNLG
jgi:ATP-dependent RNA helicase DDX35